jgi:hypothetical protein
MLAARTYPGETGFRLEVEIPTHDARDVLVKVRSAGATHGRLSLWRNGRTRLLPAVLGHEAAGRRGRGRSRRPARAGGLSRAAALHPDLPRLCDVSVGSRDAVLHARGHLSRRVHQRRHAAVGVQRRQHYHPVHLWLAQAVRNSASACSQSAPISSPNARRQPSRRCQVRASNAAVQPRALMETSQGSAPSTPSNCVITPGCGSC